MSGFKKYLPWTIRIVIFLLFLLSALAKTFGSFEDMFSFSSNLYPFEKQLVDLGICDFCIAPYIARLLIALELAIAISFLLPNFNKKFVIPGTILLLVIFCVQLGITLATKGNDGNCGCFGQLIKMSPLSALIKNILTIGLLVYLYRIIQQKENMRNTVLTPVFIYTIAALIMFIFFPFCPCKCNPPAIIPEDDSTEVPIDTPVVKIDTGLKSNIAKIDTPIVVPVIKQPTKVKSKYSQFSTFSNKKANLDEGKKILCFFVPGCEHCKETAKELTELGKTTKGFPPIYILFMNEEAEKIPEFFDFAGKKYPYTILNTQPFWEGFGFEHDTPGVAYLWNGNVIKFYDGTEAKAFKKDEFKTIVEKPWE